MTVPESAIQGYKRGNVPINTQETREMSLPQALKFVSEDHPQNDGRFESYFPAKNLYLPVDRARAQAAGMIACLLYTSPSPRDRG